jgi:mannose-6-phosphate isomerase-like protein (cupin superfamily)
MTVVSCATAEHYDWGEGCGGWLLLPGNDLLVIEERMPPATSEVRHFHSRARQFFYVLSGELLMELEGSEHVIGASHGLEIPPLARHRAMNASEQEVTFLVISSPTTRGDRTDCPTDTAIGRPPSTGRGNWLTAPNDVFIRKGRLGKSNRPSRDVL